jgi:hypothetical protein
VADPARRLLAGVLRQLQEGGALAAAVSPRVDHALPALGRSAQISTTISRLKLCIEIRVAAVRGGRKQEDQRGRRVEGRAATILVAPKLAY